MTTLQLTPHHHLASGIYAMYLENRLGDVETDCRDRFHDLTPPIRGGLSRHPLSWHSRAGGGAVHSINNGREPAQQSDPPFNRIVCDGEQMIRRSYAELLAVLRLITRSNLAGCSTAGDLPRISRAIWTAPREAERIPPACGIRTR